MLSVRLSFKEYEQLQLLCGDHGARSLSELARIALQALTVKQGQNGTLQSRVSQLDERVQVLERLNNLL